MKNTIFGVAVIAVVACVVICLTLLLTGVGWYNTAVSLEETTTAQVKQNMNLYDGMWKKINEIAQVPQQYKKDFQEVYVNIMTARYPEKGQPNHLLMKWIQESNPTLDSSVYRKVQDVIEASRNEFIRGQQDLADKQRRYAVHLKSFSGIAMRAIVDMPNELTGDLLRPKIDLDGDGKITVLDYLIITSAKTEQVFVQGGDDEPLKVFQ